MSAETLKSNDRAEFAALMHECRHDPAKFVRKVFPWGTNGSELGDKPGPRPWQIEVLESIGSRLANGAATAGEVIQEAVASGHGIGKSALVAWLILWAMFTHEDTRGVVTANTDTQLRTKTWPELSKWFRLCLGSHLFSLTATSLFSAEVGHEKTWRVDLVPWSENNTEAFAGLHNEGKRLLLIFDEASAIADKIWEVAEGALTDEKTEIIWAAIGNPTRNTGRFRDCFGRQRHRWKNRHIDSRSVDGTNKAQIAKWVADYGEDSDFIRVRVKGEFPRAGSNQFISSEMIDQAKVRQVMPDPGAPLVLGVDVARFGDDQSVAIFRQGRNADVIPIRKWRGLDTMQLSDAVAGLISHYKPDGVCVDGVGIGAGVVDRLRQMGFRVHEVQAGASAADEKLYANKRAELWGRCREWLQDGRLPDDAELRDDLIAPEYGFDNKGRILLEKKEDMKDRGLASPDVADALVLTFATNVARRDLPTALRRAARTAEGSDGSGWGFNA